MIAVGLATSVVGGLVIVPAILHHDRSAAAVSAVSPAATAADRRACRCRPASTSTRSTATSYGRTELLPAGPSRECIVVHGPGPRVLLIGDSHAQSLTPAFADRRPEGLAHARARPRHRTARGSRASSRPRSRRPTDLPQHVPRAPGRLVPARASRSSIPTSSCSCIARSTTRSRRAPSGCRTTARVLAVPPGLRARAPGRRATDDRPAPQARAQDRDRRAAPPRPRRPSIRSRACRQARYVDECRYVARANPLATRALLPLDRERHGRLHPRPRPAGVPVPADLRPDRRRRGREDATRSTSRPAYSRTWAGRSERSSPPTGSSGGLSDRASTRAVT